jgi:hypothetical protein
VDTLDFGGYVSDLDARLVGGRLGAAAGRLSQSCRSVGGVLCCAGEVSCCAVLLAGSQREAEGQLCVPLARSMTLRAASPLHHQSMCMYCGCAVLAVGWPPLLQQAAHCTHRLNIPLTQPLTHLHSLSHTYTPEHAARLTHHLHTLTQPLITRLKVYLFYFIYLFIVYTADTATRRPPRQVHEALQAMQDDNSEADGASEASFTDDELAPAGGDDPILASLFNKRGDRWKRRFVRAMNDIALRKAAAAARDGVAAGEAAEDAAERLTAVRSVR